MLVDLVNVTTEDGLRLDGALHLPTGETSVAMGVDAVLLLHGTGSNFYSSNLLGSLVRRLTEQGTAALAVNTRGHDGISTTSAPLGRRLQGAAYEMIDACRHDIVAWLALLRERGFTRLGLLGHSLGAVKAIYCVAHDPQLPVEWLVALSPPRLSHSAFLGDARGEEFRGDFERAEALVKDRSPDALIEIRFPLAYAVSARGFLDKYGTDERYNVLRLVERVACPLLVTYGTEELSQSVAFSGMPDALQSTAGHAAKLHVAVLAGADHFYSGAYAELWATIERGLRKIAAM